METRDRDRFRERPPQEYRILERRLAERLEREEFSPEMAVERIYSLLAERPKDETIDPRLLVHWDRYRDFAAGFLPPSAFKEIEKKIAAAKPVDEEVWSIRVAKATRVTFLLGAGASAPSGIPTVNGLLPELWKRAKKVSRKDLDKLALWCDERGITNIEDLLTAAYIANFAATNRGITSLLDYFLFTGGSDSAEERYIVDRRLRRRAEVDVASIGFLQDTLQTLFGLLTSTMIAARPNPVHHAIVEFVREHGKVSIVTTNYDGCIDEALLTAKLPIKSTFGGTRDIAKAGAIPLVKMHGSINWAYCDSCQEVREFDLLHLKEAYAQDRLSVAVMGICKNCGGLRRPLLVPPLSFKFLMFPNLIDIWDSARQVIETADYVIVVGYSFSEADTYITKIISRSMAHNVDQKLIVVNRNGQLVRDLRSRFSAYIDGFDPKRVIKVAQPAEKALPEVLRSFLGMARTQKASSSRSKAKRSNAKATVG